MPSGQHRSPNWPYRLARELAPPVARGQLPLGHADAALICCALKHEHKGASYHPLDVARGAQHILRLHVLAEHVARSLTRTGIERTLAPLIAMRAPRNRLLAEAHNVNGDNGFPLTEVQVDEITRTEVYWSIRKRARYGH